MYSYVSDIIFQCCDLTLINFLNILVINVRSMKSKIQIVTTPKTEGTASEIQRNETLDKLSH